MITILATIFVFAVIVLVHEWGHFITAKLTGMRVDEFAIGFGPKLWSRRRGETVYSVRALPLGGFNQIAGMTEEQAAEEQVPREKAFIYKSAPARLLVICAGALMNFVLAYVLITGVFLTNGMSTVDDRPIVGTILPTATASVQQLEPGDRILAIQNEPVTHWREISPLMQTHRGEVVSLRIERAGEERTIEVIPGEAEGRVVLGIMPNVLQRDLSFGEALREGYNRCVDILRQMYAGLAELVSGKGDASGFAGPLGIAQMAGSVASIGFVNLILFTAILSLNLGVINLLPIPLLDGGRLVVIVVESLLGRHLDEKVLYYIQMTGAAVLFMIFIFATGNDLWRLFR
ncbi:MAG: RIP metalloprotease RseP [Veillonellaceae bacterium]|nr:RIP metalloprotease RseP [Veillonellaceae bacterium]